MKIDNNNSKQTFVKRAFDLSIKIIRITETLPKVRNYWVITDQLIRSATSIGANMTEAKSASSKKDYINFYTHALKSANETVYWLTLLKELQRDHLQEIEFLIKETTELANILAASIITMKKSFKLSS